MTRQRTRALLCTAVVLSTSLLAAAHAPARREAAPRRVTISVPSVVVAAPVTAPEPDVLDIAHYYALVEDAKAVQAYLDAVWVERQAVDAYLWAIAHPPRAIARAPVTGSGDCGPVADVVGWGVVLRESTGNPYVVNASDHRGCAQISGGWWGGACSALDWTNVNDQASCARIVLDLQGPSAWAQTWG